MAEITDNLLQVLIDCQESDMPSARVVQLMASEIMRMRSYGAMVPEPQPELKHRCVLLLRNIKKDQVVDSTFQRMSTLLQPKTGIDSYEAIKDALQFIVGDSPLSDDDANWIEIDLDLLKEAEKLIHDAIGFGKSHSHVNHNDSLITLRKYIENSDESYTTVVPKKFLENIHGAVGEIVYGKNYSMAAREKIQKSIGDILDTEELATKDDQGE